MVVPPSVPSHMKQASRPHWLSTIFPSISWDVTIFGEVPYLQNILLTHSRQPFLRSLDAWPDPVIDSMTFVRHTGAICH